MAAGSPAPALPASQRLRALLYAVQPSESSFRSLHEVPSYVDQVVPLFVVFILLELVVSSIQRHKLSYRINDAISSLSAGILSQLPEAVCRGFELTGYVYIWENYRLYELPWDSPWTWYLTLLGVDFTYYWFHRLAHEVNILWATHQTHHSSEDYNLSTALRQSAVQKYISWVFYLPMALIIPPSVCAVHLQFNLLYQFWIHTEVIDNLGPLEWILNTPSHHRVHHGRNPYCIDKNYGGTLIIWDRIFGTFEAEKEKVIYGLTHPINTFEPFKVQLHHFTYIWSVFWATPGFSNKLSVIFKGPGWGPGKPRLGLSEEIPVITGKEVPFNPKLPVHLCVYAVIHFALIVTLYIDLFAAAATLSQVTVLLRIGYIILTLTSMGLLMDKRPEAARWETVRCTVFLALQKLGYIKTYPPLMFAYEVLFSLCIVFWGVQIMKQLTSSTAKRL
ncbi:alkylglycerol monooxygenase isoform X1 [Alligator mississippiensis]|uniref:Alkylglycerol monooxygenase n=1 Tax=Alligator mississippiensis TaxID=8496 RepID=A0A151MQF4_ALLMI|nr:alkylglycerol monooxygenase isoform X1 [Alligator mississippiensis]KYO26742.1 alkylglycerol monooxygenase [Alligator mississippiensis]